ncbi:MAG: HDOD domain-containing protein [Phycisphaerales bacterium]|nr:MAG: HDOD domain-containing protein [Phycisphaerales bacterium]
MSDAGKILERIGTLPPLPDTVLKLIRVLDDPRSTVDDIVETIRYDQAITGEVLRLCNSAYFGLSRKVTSLGDAMLCLGTVKVMQLVMSVHTTNLLAKAQTGYGLDPGVLWKHSVAVALASATFSDHIKATSGSVAFTAGLLHDIGKVVLNDYVADEFGEIVRRVTEEGVSFIDAERKVLGFSHEQIGGMIAEQWKLPEIIVLCIRNHHDPGAVQPSNPLVDVVYLANCTCLMLGLGLGADGLSYRAHPEVMERHELHESDLEKLGAQVLIDLKRVEGMLVDDSRTDDRLQLTGSRQEGRSRR